MAKTFISSESVSVNSILSLLSSKNNTSQDVISSTRRFELNVNDVGGDYWTVKRNSPTARYVSGSFNLNGFAYVACGLIAVATNIAEKYNDCLDSWNSIANTNVARAIPLSFELTCGYIAFGDTTTNTTDKYNDFLNTWTNVGAIDIPKRGGSGFALNGYGYAHSGERGSPSGYANTLYQFNESDSSWTSKAAFGTARTYISSFSLNGYGYSCNGSTSNTPENEINKYSDSLNVWYAAALAYASDLNSCFELNRFGYLTNGRNNSTYYSTVNCYNDSVNAWFVRNSNGTLRYANSSVSLNGFAYSFNGNSSGGYLSEVYQYRDHSEIEIPLFLKKSKKIPKHIQVETSINEKRTSLPVKIRADNYSNAIGYRSVASNSGTGVYPQTLTINKPTGVQKNDILIMGVCVGSAVNTGTLPTGWTKFCYNSTAGGHGFLAWKRATNSEPSSYSITGLSGDHNGIIASFYGCEMYNSPIDSQSSRANSGPATGTAGITSYYNGSVIINANSFTAPTQSINGYASTSPASYTEIYEISDGSAQLGMAYASKDAAGSTGASSVTGTGAFSGENVGMLCSLIPNHPWILSKSNTTSVLKTGQYLQNIISPNANDVYEYRLKLGIPKYFAANSGANVDMDYWTSIVNYPSPEFVYSSHLNGFGYCKGNIVNGLYQYNDQKNTWNLKLSSNVFCPSFSLNGMGYFIGGVWSGTYASSSYRYNDNLETFVSTTGGISAAKNYFSTYSLNSFGYVIGGFGGAATNVIERFNDSLETWSSLALVESLRYGVAGSSLNGYGYQMGGIDSGNSYLSQVSMYNDAIDVILSKLSLPGLRLTGTSFLHNNKIYFFGGMNAGTYYQDIFSYSDSNNTWVTRRSLAPGVTAAAKRLCGSFSVDKNSYIVAGEYTGPTYTNLSYKLSSNEDYINVDLTMNVIEE